MWFIDWLPAWIFHLSVLIGIAGVLASQFFSFIPVVSLYATPIRVLSIVVLVFGVYMEGGISNQEKWEARVSDLEKQVAISEEKSKSLNNKISGETNDKIRTVKETQIVIKEHIKNSENNIDRFCKVEPEVIFILNESAKNPGVKK